MEQGAHEARRERRRHDDRIARHAARRWPVDARVAEPCEIIWLLARDRSDDVAHGRLGQGGRVGVCVGEGSPDGAAEVSQAGLRAGVARGDVLVASRELRWGPAGEHEREGIEAPADGGEARGRLERADAGHERRPVDPQDDQRVGVVRLEA
jgi:hypothetical protein